jgi:hypothetical protein
MNGSDSRKLARLGQRAEPPRLARIQVSFNLVGILGRALALDDDVAVQTAQLDLPNVGAGAVNFLGDQSR